jgi:hypothetical protein
MKIDPGTDGSTSSLTGAIRVGVGGRSSEKKAAAVQSTAAP